LIRALSRLIGSTRCHLAEDKIAAAALVGGNDAAEEGLHSNLFTLSHHNNDAAAIRSIRLTGLQQMQAPPDAKKSNDSTPLKDGHTSTTSMHALNVRAMSRMILVCF
jgi:hypothetical protein